MIRLSILFASMLLLVSSCTKSTSQPNVDANNTKRITLTYDDAPLGQGPRYAGKERTAALIKQFKEAQTGPVAIFVTTQGLDKKDGVARITDYAEAGHLIANHSDTHPWASQTEIETYIADIDSAEQKLESFDNRRPWFRFPYLDEGGYGDETKGREKRDTLRRALDERDIISGYVTVDTFDWHLDRLWRDAIKRGEEVDLKALSSIYVAMVVDAAEHYDALSQEVLGRRPAQVLLLHENDLAASFTVDMVRALRAKGWTIIDPDEAFADPIVNQLPETLFSGMGRIGALAMDAGMRGSDVFDHWSASEDGIEAKVKAAAVFKSPPSELYKP